MGVSNGVGAFMCTPTCLLKYIAITIFTLAALLWMGTQFTSTKQLLFYSYPTSFFGNFGNKPLPGSETVDCNPGIPCVYPEEVDFRLIVITYNREVSLMKLLNSTQNLVLDGDTAALEIWVDRSKNGQVHNGTVEAAQRFQWNRGLKRVHIQKSHVGIYGQWIDTWRPRNPQSKELALILEDDLSISPYTYRWIKVVQKFYERRKDFGGSSLQSDEQLAHDSSRRPLQPPKNHSAFMYKCIGTWGFAPNPKFWGKFQDWYHVHINDTKFHPYVPGIIPTTWYQMFEGRGTQDSMWEMWFIYFAYVEQLFTVYNNLGKYNNDAESLSLHQPQGSRTSLFLQG